MHQGDKKLSKKKRDRLIGGGLLLVLVLAVSLAVPLINHSRAEALTDSSNVAQNSSVLPADQGNDATVGLAGADTLADQSANNADQTTADADSAAGADNATDTTAGASTDDASDNANDDASDNANDNANGSPAGAQTLDDAAANNNNGNSGSNNPGDTANASKPSTGSSPSSANGGLPSSSKDTNSPTGSPTSNTGNSSSKDQGSSGTSNDKNSSAGNSAGNSDNTAASGSSPAPASPAPANPAPASPAPASPAPASPTITLSIDATTYQSGYVILPPTTVSITDGESAFDVLYTECKARGIQMASRFTPIYNSAYVQGIDNLYEFDGGQLSGWMYSVNGWFPNYGSSVYKLHDGDVMAWRYTLDLGRDVGGYYATGGS